MRVLPTLICLLIVTVMHVPAAEIIISADDNDSVALPAGDNLTVNAGITVSNTANTANHPVSIQGNGSTITNNGTISSNTNIAAVEGNATTGGIITNAAGATITNTDPAAAPLRASEAIRVGENYTITNNGTLSTSGFNNIVTLGNNCTLTNNNVMTGVQCEGIQVTGTGNTITNTGTIIVPSWAVYGDSANVNNSGTIDSSAGDEQCVWLTSGAITNSGLIKGSTGILGKPGGGLTVINEAGGTVQGTGYAIRAESAISITNRGTITGDNGIIAGAADDVVINSGTITGTGGTAIDLGLGINSLTLQAGSVINGEVTGVRNLFLEDGLDFTSTNPIRATRLRKTDGGTSRFTAGAFIDFIYLHASNGTMHFKHQDPAQTTSHHWVVVDGGTLNLDGKAHLGGGVEVSGGILNVNNALKSGSLSISGGLINVLSGSESQNTYVNGGTVKVDAAYINNGSTVITNGLLDVNSSYSSASTEIQGGSVDVDGTLTTSGLTTIKGGTLNANATYNSGSTELQNGTVNVAGTFTNNGATTIKGGVLNVTSNYSSDTTIIQGGTTTVAGAYTNAASTTVQGGVLRVAGNYNSGTTHVESGMVEIQAGHQLDTGAATTTVAGGTVTVNGTLDSDTIIQSGGFMNGSGTVVGGLTNSGRLAPGNSIGTLHVNGNYVQNAGSIYEVEIATDGTSDKIETTGTVTINGGSVKVIRLEDDRRYAESMRYTIVSAAGGLAGKFAELSEDSARLDFSLSYDAHNAYLTIDAFSMSYAAQAATGNQMGIAKVLDTISPTATGDMATVLNQLDLLSAPELRSALKQMTPEALTSLTAIAHQASAGFGGIVRQRAGGVRSGQLFADASLADVLLADGPGPAEQAVATFDSDRWNVFFKTFGVWSDQDGRSDVSGYEAQTTGIAGGLDRMLNACLLIGCAAGGAWSDINFDDSNRSGSDIDSAYGTLYGSWFNERLYVDLGVGYARNWYDSSRNVQFGGISREARSDFHGDEWSASLGGGYRFDCAGFLVEPTASLHYSALYQDNYNERGAGDLNLSVDEEASRNLQSVFGLRVARKIEFDSGFVLVPEARAGWVHEYSQDAAESTARLAGGGGSFTVEGLPVDEDRARLGLGLTGVISSKTSVFFDYGFELGNEYENHAAQFGLQWAF